MKTLVAYYSLGGNTKEIAEKVARALRADVIEIKTVKDYPDDYDVLLSLGQKEVASGYIPALQPVQIDWDKYETVLLGSPVWWSSFAPAMKKFLSNYNWKGRVVYPFVTHGGTVGHVAGDFKRACAAHRWARFLASSSKRIRSLHPTSSSKNGLRQSKTVGYQIDSSIFSRAACPAIQYS